MVRKLTSVNTNAISRGRSTALVPFLFGVAGEPELPGVVLVGLLADVGLTASAARALIARMRGAGHVASSRRGRMVTYRLAGEMERGFHRVRDGRRGAAWRGSFHAVLYQVPEGDRSYRDTL